MTASKLWAVGGALLGAAVALVVFAPAAWLAASVASGTSGRLLLADARGTVWQGSAVLVLTGGVGSNDASALPGRLQWSMGVGGNGFAPGLTVQARHACCINEQALVRVLPGFSRTRIEVGGTPTAVKPAPAIPATATPVAPSPAAPNPLTAVTAGEPQRIGQWPTAWLAGLGTPWNTLQLSGQMRLSTPGLSLTSVQGRWVMGGQADLALDDIASRVSTLDVLGSYQLSLVGDPKGDSANLSVSTRSGALLLSGTGTLGLSASSRFRFSGQASAAPGAEAPLNNLLNIIGRRQGPLSLISIG
jgi:general secretion pathway protein N